MNMNMNKIENCKISVPRYISSSSYFFETEKSRAYIFNDKYYDEFVLDGITADLWKIIVDSENYDTVYEYAKLKQVDSELDDFLNELYSIGIIELDGKLNHTQKSEFPPEKNSLTEDEIKTYDSQKDAWLVNNGFLPELTIELTYNCNQKCIHCYNEKDNKTTEINIKNIKKIIDDAIKCGVYRILLTGGECTTHKDFYEIAKYVKSKRLELSLITNGQILHDNPSLLNKLMELYPFKVRLSLYSVKPGIHDKITGIKGSQAKTIKVIETLRKHHINTGINFFQLNTNKNCIKDVEKYAIDNDISFSCSMYLQTNKKNSNCFDKLKEEDLLDMLSDKENKFSAETNVYKEINEDLMNLIICKAGVDRLVVSPFLKVYPCISLTHELGDLKTTPLYEIWHGQKLKDYKAENIYRNLKDCFKEEYCKYCTYCPSLNYQNKGEFAKSDMCCEIAKAVMKVRKKERNTYETTT